MTYAVLFRRKVLSVREKESLTIAQVAKRFCVGVASVTRWIKTPDPKTTRNKPATRINMDVNEVLKAGDELQGLGLIYTTVDDHTWAVLEV